MSFNGSINIEFGFVNPFAANGFLTWGKVGEYPCFVGGKGLYFIIHSIDLVRLGGILFVRGGVTSNGYGIKECVM